MNIIFIVQGMPSAAYECNSWICGVFDSYEKAMLCVQELESEEDAEEYIYMIKNWEVR